MARRQIKDERGISWDVWDVHPNELLSSSDYDRRAMARPDQGEPLLMLSAELEQGWLCFQAGAIRRRFAPIPPSWADLPDGVLRVMLDVANPVVASGDMPVHSDPAAGGGAPEIGD